MSSWGWYPKPASKKAPPARGIKLKQVGQTWWGQLWISALELVLQGDSARLARGRTYARAGRTHDLVVNGGKVTARVTGSRSAPYKITIEVGQLAPAVWEQAIVGMAAKAQFSAELLDGQMPREIEQVFVGAGASLFPRKRAELKTNCSCSDWGDPCKHVAATHYVLGEALEQDPFLLFELRGRSKEQVLAALRQARGDAPAVPSVGSAARTEPRAAGPSKASTSKAITSKAARPSKASTSNAALAAVTADVVPSVELGKLKAADYDRAREVLPQFHFTFDEPLSSGALLRQLGAPAAWRSPESPASALSALVQRAAASARRMALAEPELPAGSVALNKLRARRGKGKLGA